VHLHAVLHLQVVHHQMAAASEEQCLHGCKFANRSATFPTSDSDRSTYGKVSGVKNVPSGRGRIAVRRIG
jgi:hypothetical protein